MTDGKIEREAESIVAAYNNAAPEYAPELSWYGMTALRDDGDDVRQGFVFDTHQYLDQDGLWALRKDGRHIEYAEAESTGQEPRVSVVFAALGREVRDD